MASPNNNSEQPSFWLRALEVGVLVVMEAAIWTLFENLPKWFLYGTIIVGLMVICALELRRKQGRAYKTAPWVLGIVYILLFVYAAFKPINPTPSVLPISFRLGCQWDHIPIHIGAASTIHVIRLYRGTLIPVNCKMTIPDQGSSEDISSSADASLDWPSDHDGKWMTKDDFGKSINDGHGIPNSWAFKCTMTSYSAPILDEILAFLIIDTPDKQRHTYKVPFDPITSSSPGLKSVFGFREA